MSRKPAATYRHNKLQQRLRRQVASAIKDYRMIEPGQRVMVCLSGGKDSHTLLDILLSLRDSGELVCELQAVNLDQKQPGFPAQVLPEYLASRGVDYHVIEQDTWSVVKQHVPEGKTTCSLCSRLRRGALYHYAQQQRIDRIALGHHRDDIIETLFLNLFHGGRLKAMPPKLLSDNRQHVVIRPLAYCKEADIAQWAQVREFPIIPCNLCGSNDQLARVEIKRMLQDWQKRFPGRVESVFNALQQVAPSQLADRALFDFGSLSATTNPPEAALVQLDPRQKV